MSETMTEEKNMSIRSAVMASISDARDAVVNLAKSFGEHVSGLRVNESEEVFEGLAQNFKDLKYFIYFMEEIRTALAAMKGLEIEASLGVSQENSILNNELFLCEKMLDKDERNFHVWNYRNWVTTVTPEFNKFYINNELAFTRKKIE